MILDICKVEMNGYILDVFKDKLNKLNKLKLRVKVQKVSLS